MSFFQISSNYKQFNRLTTSLQTHPYSQKIHPCLLKIATAITLQLCFEEKRMSLLTLQRKREYAVKCKRTANASLTLEAALVLPIFFMLIGNLLSLIIAIQTEIEITNALHQIGREMAVYAYLYPNQDEENSEILDMAISVLVSNTYGKNQVLKWIGKDRLDKSMVKGGYDGFSFLRSSFMDQDIIDLVATYYMEMPFVIDNPMDFKMLSRCRIRAWTGYEIQTQTENETTVYITETGSVYHTTKECSHLDLSIHSCTVIELGILENQNGSNYKKCEECSKTDAFLIYYITDWGDKYHSTISCSGLKRTVIAIPYSKKGDRKLCKRCGGLD